MAAKAQGVWQLLQQCHDLSWRTVQRGDARLSPEAGKGIINLQAGLPQLSRFWNTLPHPRGPASDVGLCLEARV